MRLRSWRRHPVGKAARRAALEEEWERFKKDRKAASDRLQALCQQVERVRNATPYRFVKKVGVGVGIERFAEHWHMNPRTVMSLSLTASSSAPPARLPGNHTVDECLGHRLANMVDAAGYDTATVAIVQVESQPAPSVFNYRMEWGFAVDLDAALDRCSSLTWRSENRVSVLNSL